MTKVDLNDRLKFSFSDLISHIIFLMLLTYLLIDTINGALLRAGLMSISLIWKLLMLSLMFAFFIHSKIVIAVLSFLVFYHMMHVYIIGDVVSASIGLVWLIKFLLLFMSYLFIADCLNRGMHDWLFKIANAVFLFLATNIVLGLFGFGYAQYGEGREIEIGVRGFIFAGNEMGAALVAASSLILMRLTEQRRFGLFLLAGSFIVLLSAALTSKVSILASFLMLGVFPLIRLSRQLRFLQLANQDAWFASILLIVLPLLIFGGLYYALYVANLIERLSYMYQKLDLVTLIFSHRNIWAEQALHLFWNDFTPLEQLFGRGDTWIAMMPDTKTVEIDLIDFLMSYGLLGVLLTYGFWLFVIARFIWSKNNPYLGYGLFMTLIFLAMSLTAGHVFNSGTAAPIIGALLALSHYQAPLENQK